MKTDIQQFFLLGAAPVANPHDSAQLPGILAEAALRTGYFPELPQSRQLRRVYQVVAGELGGGASAEAILNSLHAAEYKTTPTKLELITGHIMEIYASPAQEARERAIRDGGLEIEATPEAAFGEFYRQRRLAYKGVQAFQKEESFADTLGLPRDIENVRVLAPHMKPENVAICLEMPVDRVKRIQKEVLNQAAYLLVEAAAEFVKSEQQQRPLRKSRSTPRHHRVPADALTEG